MVYQSIEILRRGPMRKARRLGRRSAWAVEAELCGAPASLSAPCAQAEDLQRGPQKAPKKNIIFSAREP